MFRAKKNKGGFTPSETMSSSLLSKNERVSKRIVDKMDVVHKRPPKGGLSLSGFTFVEMMVVAVLTAIIGLGLASTFQAGMNVWKRVSSPRYSHRKAVLGLERLTRELRSIAYYPTEKTVWENARIAFVNFTDDKIYEISYYYSDRDKCLYYSRKVKQDKTNSDEPELRKIISGVKSFNLNYRGYYFSSKRRLVPWNGNFWKSQWGIPAVVRFELIAEDGSRFEKDVSVPIVVVLRSRR